MSKPTSGISSAVSIRISNELLEAVKGYAIANNIINTSGRNDDRGKPNLSQAFSELVSVALGLNTVSDSVSSSDNSDLRDTVKKLSDTVLTLSDRLASVENAIATFTSEATAPAKKPTESDNQEPETLPIIEAIENINTPLVTSKSQTDKTTLVCPNCSAVNPYKNGLDNRTGKQKYKCKKCSKQWVSA
jgi:ABC-type transporter Mla subunit MlaD